MSVPKKEALVVLVLVGVILLMGGFFLEMEKRNLDENYITGAAVSNLRNTVAVPEIEKDIGDKEIESIGDSSESIDLLAPTVDVEVKKNVIQEIGIQVEANQTQCGVVNGNITLRTNVNSSRTCFHINRSNIIIDCAGFMINYTTTNTSDAIDGYGVNNTGFQNVTIKSCYFLDGNITNTNFAIDFRGNGTSFPFGGLIFNNTFVGGIAINLTDANSTNVTSNLMNDSGIFVWRGGNITINLNRIYPTSGRPRSIYLVNSKLITVDFNNITNADSLYVVSTDYSTISNNNITTSGDEISGIRFDTDDINGYSEYNSVSNNRIRTNGTNGYGIRLVSNNYSNIFNNDIYTDGISALGIWLGDWNIISNNNISANLSTLGAGEFRDSGNSKDIIVYNSSFGRIEWIDNGTGGFIADKSSKGRVGYSYNFFMANNSLAFNGTDFRDGLMNSSPRKMTLYDLPFGAITNVFRLANISTNETFIRIHGTDCVGNGCSIVGYGAGKYIFNTTLLGSFAINGTEIGSNTAPNTTQFLVNASTYLNHTDDTLYCRAKGQDNEQTLLDAYWTWYRNGAVYTSGVTTVNNGTLTTLTSISSGNTERGDEWNCSVYMYDGFVNESDSANATLSVAPYICSDTITTSTTLVAHVTGCSGNGLGITTSNVTLDCDHKLIAGSAAGIGINVSGTNITIKNCNISGFKDGIYLTNVLYSTIFNNTINGSGRLGIYMADVNFTNITLNTIKDTTTGGIYINGTSTNIMKNNTFSNNTILRNRAVENGDDDMVGGIAFESLNAYDQIIQHNNFSHNLRFAVVALLNNATFQYNFYWNNSEGIVFPNDDNIIYGEKFIGNGVAINGSSEGKALFVRNSVFEENTKDLKISDGATGNITFINSTMNKDKLFVPANSYAYFKSYVDVNVSLPGGTALFNATAEAYTSEGILNDQNTTNNNGTARLLVTEFYNTNGINYIITPSTIKVYKGNFTKNSTEIDLLNLSYYLVNVSITEITCGSSIVSSVLLGANYFCSGNGITITANNITVEGGNRNISGLMAGDGFKLLGVQRVSIDPIFIQNFTSGIYVQDTNNSNFTLLRIVNTTIGIYFNNSNDNLVLDSVIGNNTNSSIYAISDVETNNTLINVSIYNLENMSVGGSASLYRGWYVDVNTTLNGFTPFSNVDVAAYIDATDSLEVTGVTDSRGIERLSLKELKKNSSGVTYRTPHNITMSYTYQGVTYVNSSVVNLTAKNNTMVHLSLVLNCTAPTTDSNISVSTTFCPGTFTATGISLNTSGVTLTCDNTYIQGGISVLAGANHTTIRHCAFTTLLYVTSARNVTFEHSNSSGIDCTSSTNILITNLTTAANNGVGLSFTDCNNTILSQSLIRNYVGMSVGSSSHNLFKNNTFKGNNQAIFLGGYNNSYYYNNFTSVASWYYRNTPSSDTTFNTTATGPINTSAQGNEYADYCEKGRDLNNDGYADTNSIGSVDYPYNYTVSTHISEPGVVDYGPKITTCPATTVFLTSSGASSSSAKASAGGGAAVAAPSAPSAATAATSASSNGNGGSSGGGSFYSAADVKKFLKTSEGAFESKKSEQGIDVFVTLENTGYKPMKINPTISQEVGDPYFMLTRKTLGSGDNSGLQTIAKLSYSKNPIAGTLLKAILVNQEEIVIPPGGKVEKALQVKEGFGATKPLKIQFSSLGETVLEKDVKVDKKASSAAALDTHENYIDIYAILVPEGAQKSEGVIVGSELTGAAILDKIPMLANSNSPYFLELSLNKKNKFGKLHTVFSDQYGPYPLKQKESFLFAQQLKYDAAIYNGEYVVQTKMYHGPALVVKNEFDVTLGENKETGEGSVFVWLGLLAIIMIILAQSLYFMKVHYKN